MKKTLQEVTKINEPFIIDKEKGTELQTYIVRFTDLTSSLMYWNTKTECEFTNGQAVEVTSENLKKPFKFGNESFSTKVRLSVVVDNPNEEKNEEPQRPPTKTRDEAIIFQNQSHLVQKHFNDCGICPELIDINLATALQVQFVIEGFTKELSERFQSFEKYISEKYKG